MKHYVCAGECGGVSESPMSCQMKSCAKHDVPLKPCTCEDKKHAQVLSASAEEDSE